MVQAELQETTYRFKKGFNDGRINITKDEKIFDITITRINEQDIATYFCAQVMDNLVEFGSGTLLVLQRMSCRWFLSTILFTRGWLSG